MKTPNTLILTLTEPASYGSTLCPLCRSKTKSDGIGRMEPHGFLTGVPCAGTGLTTTEAASQQNLFNPNANEGKGR